MALRPNLILLSLFLLGALCIIIFINWMQSNTSIPESINPSANGKWMDVSLMKHYHSSLSFPVNHAQRKKVILSWTAFFYDYPTDEKNFFENCPELYRVCELTSNEDQYMDADAIVFHAPNVNWSHLPPDRNQNQRYVFFFIEPPTKDWFEVDVIENFYNWTMTYRMDSDIPYPYSYLVFDPKASQVLDEVSIINKTGTVVWFVSTCQAPSKREKYVEELKKYIPVDIYGHCGVQICPKLEARHGNHTPAQCEKDLINRVYKFYIAFENSVCRDYISEKFLHRRNFNSVPIVLSRKMVEDYFPPNSFIAADDFTGPGGPKKLADYLKYLMENHDEYLKYFEWKKIGYSDSKAHPITGLQWGFCGLCQKLWRLEMEGRKESKVYKWMNDWNGENVSCDANFMSRLLG